MRIVLDTNIVISALLWRGTPYQLLETARQQSGFRFFSSTILLEELANVLKRPTVNRQLGTIGKTVDDILTDYIEVIELVEPAGVPEAVSRDPDDDHVLACALAARADYVVSGDADLLDLEQYQGIRIVTASEAIRKLA